MKSIRTNLTVVDNKTDIEHSVDALITINDRGYLNVTFNQDALDLIATEGLVMEFDENNTLYLSVYHASM